MKSIYREIGLGPKKLLFIVIYCLVFLKAVVQSNLDVALRVLKPKMPINPGIVKVKTKLKSKMGRLALANSITLTPGTITVDIYDDELYIHWINITSADVDDATQKIVTQFEKYLEVIFG
jgi:multicomponent Na+:H+ antiporter subunit E